MVKAVGINIYIRLHCFAVGCLQQLKRKTIFSPINEVKNKNIQLQSV